MKKVKINNYSDTDYKKFKKKSVIKYNFNISSDNSDYSWIQIFEEYMPNLDAIVRNPRRFIQSDESLVPIEKAKKISEESIKHLAQNTHLIQSIDKDGMPQPLKILNIYKEETYDLYENRFIASLINNLYIFINMQYEKLRNVDVNNYGSQKNITYDSKTLIDEDEYSSNLKINIKRKQEEIDIKAVKEKIDELHEVVMDFKHSSLMKELERAEPVRSPIRKTNAILKDVQLNKCLELWEILEQLQNSIRFDSDDSDTVIDENSFVENLTLANYINFCGLTNRVIIDNDGIDDKSKHIFYDLIRIYTERPEIGIENFRKELIDDLDMLCMQYEKDYYGAKKVYDDFLNSFDYYS